MKHRHAGKVRYRTSRGNIRYRKKPIHKITLKKKQRKIFQQLDKEPFETGGYMDFDERGLERADVYIGSEASVDIRLDPDKEVEYHIHPQWKGSKFHQKRTHFPSKWDILEFKNTPSQTMVIFHDGKAMVLHKKNNRKVPMSRLNKAYDNLRKDARTNMPVEKMVKKYRPIYKKMGLDIKYIKHKGSIKLPGKVIEPEYKELKKTQRKFFEPRDEVGETWTEEGGFLFGRKRYREDYEDDE